MEEKKRTKKTKAIYTSISNEIGRSCKTIKCNKEMTIRPESADHEVQEQF
jgi:hypothetical protein